MSNPIYALILAGGSGERFWPLSRRARPKQLLRLVAKNTLLEQTVARLDGLIPPERILEEHRATNTGENVIFSLPILDAALGLANIRSVICLGNTWTARRYPMTLHRHWPEVEKLK